MRLPLLALLLSVGLTAPPMALAQEGTDDEADRPVTREEVQQKKRELREMERELRRQEEERQAQARRPAERQERRRQLRVWAGVGAGVGWGAVDVPCRSGSFGDDCREEGVLNTYTANVTVAGRDGALRLRGLRQSDKGDDSRTPYETAALIGARFGGSNWYGLVGYGRVRHPDDEFVGTRAGGFAWEILFAPSSTGLTGFELSFQGNSGDEVDFVGFNLGMRLGLLR